MGITISNNGAVQRASYHLSKAQNNFQKSIRRLASGKRIVGASEDPGTLAVAMKVQASINQLTGAQNNVRSGIGFLEMQDGLLDTAGRILMRMSELKGYSTQDPLRVMLIRKATITSSKTYRSSSTISRGCPSMDKPYLPGIE